MIKKIISAAKEGKRYRDLVFDDLGLSVEKVMRIEKTVDFVGIYNKLVDYFTVNRYE